MQSDNRKTNPFIKEGMKIGYLLFGILDYSLYLRRKS